MVGLLFAGFGLSALALEDNRVWIALLGLLALLSLPACWHRRHQLLSPADLWPLAALLAWPLVLKLLRLWHGGLDRLSTYSWYFLAALLIVPLLRLSRPSRLLIVGSLSLGALAAFPLALWQVLVEDMPRAGGHWHFIVFGNLALLLGVLPLFALRAPWMTPAGRVLVLAGAVAGLLVSWLSASRGGWLALPLLLGVAAGLELRPLWQQQRRLLLGVLGGGLLLAALAGTSVAERFAEGWNDLQQYQAGQVETSLGMRLEMWQVALDMAAERPLLGAGPAAFHQQLLARVQQGHISPRLTEFLHAHNDFLDALISGGIPRLLALLALYLLPLVFFLRRWHTAGDDRVFALMGALAIGCMMIFGLSESMLFHPVTHRVLAMLLALCLGMLLPPASPQDTPNA